MISRPFEANPEVAHRQITAQQTAVSVQPKPSLGLFQIVVVLSASSTLLIAAVMALTRIGSIPAPPELLPSYLPGNPLPEGTTCYVGSSEVIPRCSIHYLDQEIHFRVNAETQLIDTTIIPSHAYRLGQLILAWGTPDSISRTSHTTYIHWGPRSAHLYTDSAQPNSRVEFITYDLEPKPASPWRGFGLDKR